LYFSGGSAVEPRRLRKNAQRASEPPPPLTAVETRRSTRQPSKAGPDPQWRSPTSKRKTRVELVAQRTTEAKALAGLQVEKAGIDSQRRVAEADLGPVRYLATLIGAGDQDVMRWFILVVALMLDPAAVLLLLAAASARK